MRQLRQTHAISYYRVDAEGHRPAAGASMRMQPAVKTTGRFRVIGWVGVVVATPFFLWLLLGGLGVTPSMVEVFGISGLRIPAAVTITGLLLAAVGFHDL